MPDTARERLARALEKTACALQVAAAGPVAVTERSVIRFTGRWGHLGSMAIKDILDEANEALAASPYKDNSND